VTGGASGIGLALCRELALRGVNVVVADVAAEGAQKVAQQITSSGGRADAAPIDVTDYQAVVDLMNHVLDEFGRIDFVFNNAGVNVVGETLHLELDDWERLLSINLQGVIHGVVAAYPVMVHQRSGHIVNVASLAGLTPAPFEVPYAATKHAVVGLSLSLRAEARKYGVRVSVVCPGFIDTPMPDTQRVVGVDREKMKASIPVSLYPADRCARDILDGVARNKSIIVVTRFAKLAYLAKRLSPSLVDWVTWRAVRRGLD
jgi:NAD(P)-dependent dehydrogenase (short-subunit alcohol dehydrogenase family)